VLVSSFNNINAPPQGSEMWFIGMKTPSNFDGCDVEKAAFLIGLYLKQRSYFPGVQTISSNSFDKTPSLNGDLRVFPHKMFIAQTSSLPAPCSAQSYQRGLQFFVMQFCMTIFIWR